MKNLSELNENTYTHTLYTKTLRHTKQQLLSICKYLIKKNKNEKLLTIN